MRNWFPAMMMVVACTDGGQSGTDQFDVDRTPSGQRRDAGGDDSNADDDANEPATDDDSEIVAPDDDVAPDAQRPPTLPEVESICDGTERVRFSGTFAGPGGPVAFYNAFLPATILVIDGNCRYWIDDASLRGLRSGVLTPDAAEMFSESVRYGQYAALSAYELPQCPDGGARWLTDSTARLTCRCGSCGSAPDEFREPFAALDALYAELAERDEWAWGPTSILPLVAEPSAGSLEWTLDLELSSVAIEGGLEQPFGSDSGVLIEEAEQLGLLAALRESAIAAGDASLLGVTDDEASYLLYVRDELPERVADALDAEIHE